jgi:hypothetical protein
MPRRTRVDSPKFNPFAILVVDCQRAHSGEKNFADAPKIAIPALALAVGRYTQFQRSK